MTVIAPELKRQWKARAPYLTISNEQEYDKAVERLNILLDEVEDDESHPLYSLLDTLGILIEAYDNEHYPLPDCNGIESKSKVIITQIFKSLPTRRLDIFYWEFPKSCFNLSKTKSAFSTE